MGPVLERYEQKSIVIISEGIQKGYPLLRVKSELRKACPVFLNDRECATLVKGGLDLYRSAKSTYRGGGKLEDIVTSTVLFKNYEHVLNTVHFGIEKKAKAITVLKPIEVCRANGGVFYMVSIHQKPACGHKPYQGKIVIDRFWRSALNGDDETVRRVEAYLKDHNVDTLQELMKDPVWLVTRRNCRHHFVPVPTYEVLTMPVGEVKALHPEIHDHAHRSLTPKQLYAKKKNRVKNIKSLVKAKTSLKIAV